jgi:signal transduction histidine kinase
MSKMAMTARRLTGMRRSETAQRVPSPRTVSTRVRLLGWYVVLLAVAIAFGLFLQRSVLLAQVDDEVNDQLQQEADELARLSGGLNPTTGQPFGGDVEAIFATFLSRNLPVEDEALFTLIGGQPYRSTVTPLQLLDDPEVVAEWAAVQTPARSEIDSERGAVRYLAVPVLVEGEIAGTFVVAIFLDGRREDVNDALRVGAIVYGSTFLVASAFAWFAAGRVLRPVRLLTETARSITESNWSRRLPVRGDDEIAELARTFNEMLGRLEEAFAVQRRLIDDAGHELRTPITIIRGHLELLNAGVADRDETIHLVIDELDRMTRIVEDLLLLARTEQPDFLDPHPIDVAEFTEQLASKARALSPDRPWQVDETAAVVMDADGQRLTQAVMNLVRNAVEHTQSGALSMGSRAQGDHVLFWVRDEGPGIPWQDQRRIFERFSRGSAGQRLTEGAGLGLAIVKAVSEAHGGTVVLDSVPGRGSTFTLVLPLRLGGGAAT